METIVKGSLKEQLINRIEKITSERAFYIYIMIFMIAIPGAEFISELLGTVFVTQPYIHMCLGYVGFGMAVLKFGINIWKRNIKLSDVFFSTLLMFLVISYIFSHERVDSIRRFNYEEILPNFLAYYSLMFAATHIETYKYRKRVLFCFIGLALFESVICVFQSFGIRIMNSCFDPIVHAHENLAFGLAQHQNFYGGLSVLFFGAVSGVFIFYVNKKWVLPAGILTLLVLYGSLSTSARLTWLGNGAVLFFLLISILIMRKKIQDKGLVQCYLRRFAILVGIVIAAVVIILLSSNKIQTEIEQTGLEIAGNSMSEEERIETGNTHLLGNARVYLWSFAFESLPDNWLTGVGPDNFRWCFLNSPRWSQPMWYNDKAHNEYIHTMITLGVPALINYMAMLLFAIVTAVKNIVSMKCKEQNVLTWIFLGMMSGYMAQALVNSSVINIAMYFWITVGMCMPKCSQQVFRGKGKKDRDEK